MKKIIMCCVGVCLLLASPVFAYQVDTDTKITQEAMMRMSNEQRNAVFEGLRKQAELEVQKNNPVSKVKMDKETIQTIANMDIETFKGKALAVADTLVTFFDKLGVKANEFVKTDVGFIAVLGIVYQMGVFSSIWKSFIGITMALVFLRLLYKLNTKKKVTLKRYDREGKPIAVEDVMVSGFSAMADNENSRNKSLYSIWGSIVCCIMLIICMKAIL